MKTSKLVLAALFSSLFAGTASAAIEGNIGVTSEYMWRGMSQTNGGAAVSGGLDWSGESGWSGGVWASNINWGSNEVDAPGSEFDLYAGYSSSFGALDYSVTGIYYVYSQYDGSDFSELLVDLSYAGVDFGFGYTLTAETDSQEGDLYYYVGKSFELTDELGAGVTFGQYAGDEVGEYEGHSFFKIDVTKGDFTLSAAKSNDKGGYTDDLQIFASWGTTF